MFKKLSELPRSSKKVRIAIFSIGVALLLVLWYLMIGLGFYFTGIIDPNAEFKTNLFYTLLGLLTHIIIIITFSSPRVLWDYLWNKKKS